MNRMNHSLALLIFLSLTLQSSNTNAQTEITLLPADPIEAVNLNQLNNGSQMQDISWQDYRLMDANGFLKVLDDVLGPINDTNSFTVSNSLLWNRWPMLRPQTRYADFGGTCDLNNPSSIGWNKVVFPPRNSGNGTLVDSISQLPLNYQSGTFTTCDGNRHYSQESFSPKPLLTREAWIYRSCRMITIASTSENIARMMNRVLQPAPTPSGSSSTLNYVKDDSSNDSPTPPPYNWCQNIHYPSSSDINELFQAFYPGRTIPQIPIIKDISSPIINSKKTSGNITETKILSSSQNTVSYRTLSFGGTASMTPRYKEKLIEMLQSSDQFIDSLSNPADLGESLCVSPLGSTPIYPTIDQIKAVNAWRALFMTMCMDPGWTVY